MGKTLVELMGQGIQADRSGNHRLAAAKFLQAFHAPTNRWDPSRWQIFNAYTATLKDSNLPVSLEDEIASLKAIIEDKKELKLYRIEAAWTAGILCNDRAMKRDEAADYIREAIELAEKIPAKEKKHKVFVPGKSRGTPQSQSMAKIISPIVDECKKTLDRLSGNIWGEYSSLEEALRAKGIDFPGLDGSKPITMHMLGQDRTLTSEELGKLQTVGGETCDCCGKSREELGQTLLDVCARCKKAYYCGRECQVKQWKAGHKKCCRKPGEFKAEDLICLFGLQSRPELNGTRAKVIGEDPENKGHWKVKANSGMGTISVACDKMQQLRPLK